MRGLFISNNNWRYMCRGHWYRQMTPPMAYSNLSGPLIRPLTYHRPGMRYNFYLIRKNPPGSDKGNRP